MAIIDISKMDRAWVLMRLFNAARPLGPFGKDIDYVRGPLKVMTLEEAQAFIARCESSPSLDSRYYFDYVFGRPLKVNLRGPTLDDRLYARDQGEGTAAAALGVEGS
jgi:hypothetical protein